MEWISAGDVLLTLTFNSVVTGSPDVTARNGL